MTFVVIQKICPHFTCRGIIASTFCIVTIVSEGRYALERRYIVSVLYFLEEIRVSSRLPRASREIYRCVDHIYIDLYIHGYVCIDSAISRASSTATSRDGSAETSLSEAQRFKYHSNAIQPFGLSELSSASSDL